MHLSTLEQRIALLGMGVRVVLYLVLLASASGQTYKVSRDSEALHYRAMEIAIDYGNGLTEWGQLIDNAWPLVVGILYYYTTPSLLLVVGVSAVASGISIVLTYRIALMVTSNRLVAAAAGYTVALFPSAVFFQCLPIKESVAMLSILWVAWGLLRMRLQRDAGGVKWILLGTMVIIGLRVYLAPILIYCVALTLLIRGGRSIAAAIAQLTIWSVFLVVAAQLSFDLGGLDWRQIRAFEYLDMERLNTVRGSLARGTGAFVNRHSYSRQYAFGNSLANDVFLLGTGVYYFLIGIDFFNVRSARQWAAVPEALVVLFCLPYMFVGVRSLWRYHRTAAVPILIITVALFTVYGAGTTNMGAMYRWRLQAMPFLAMTIYLGAAHWRRGPAFALLKIVRNQLPRRRFAPVFEGPPR